MERKCEVVGCRNLGEVDTHRNGKRYRKKICSSHKRKKYGMRIRSLRSKLDPREKFRKDGFANKCEICSWEGPCDVHRKIHGSQGGRYVKGNMISLCPNCHRLHHVGKLFIEGGSEVSLVDFNKKQFKFDI